MKVAIFGLGRIGYSLESDPFRKKPCTHYGTIASDFGKDRFSFEIGFEIHPKPLERFREATGKQAILVSENLKESIPFLKNLDLVVIATPSSSHEQIATFCLKQGIKNLLIEKPVCLNSLGAKKLLRLAKQKKARIWINHERRYHPSYLWVFQEFQKGNLGKIQSIRASVFTSAKNPGLAFQTLGGGPLLHDGTHALDLIQWFLGKCKLLQAKVWVPKLGKTEDRAVATFVGKKGEIVFIDVSGGRDYFQFELDIHTDKTRVLLSNDGFRFYKSETSLLYKGFRSLNQYSPREMPKESESNAFLGIYSEVYEIFTKKKRAQNGTLADNIEVLEMIESIYRRKK